MVCKSRLPRVRGSYTRARIQGTDGQTAYRLCVLVLVGFTIHYPFADIGLNQAAFALSIFESRVELRTVYTGEASKVILTYSDRYIPLAFEFVSFSSGVGDQTNTITCNVIFWWFSFGVDLPADDCSSATVFINWKQTSDTHGFVFDLLHFIL